MTASGNSVTTRKSLWHAAAQWLVAVVVLPLMLLAAAEWGLRLADFGVSRAPFLEKRDGDNVFCVRNKAFLDQFFPIPVWPGQWRHEREFALTPDKPADTYRIFVFGESAAMGWPIDRQAFSNILKLMLKARFPSVTFEIYNTAFPGINSHVIEATAAACVRFQPDLFLVYMGNNEFQGPFGLSNGSKANPHVPGLAHIRLNMALCQLRLLQLLPAAKTSAPALLRAQGGVLDTSVRADDPRAARVCENFRGELNALCRIARRAHAGIVLSTVGANLRHWQPTGPSHRPSISDAELEQWESLYRRAENEETQGAFAAARDDYEKAREIDDTYSELHFRLGRCYWELEAYDKAREAYARALDLDSFVWVRAKSRINETIRRVAERMAPQGVRLADVETVLAAHSPHGVPGIEFFVDGCHPNFDGNYLIACTLFDEAVKLLPEGIRARGADVSTPLSRAECARLLGFLPQHELQGLSSVVSTNQLLDKEPMDILKQRMRQFEETVGSELPNPCGMELDEMLEGIAFLGTDYFIGLPCTEQLLNCGRFDEAVEHARALVARYPFSRASHRLLGEAFVEKGERDAALAEFRRELELYPDDAPTYLAWGKAVEADGKLNDALVLYQKARLCDEYDIMVQYAEAHALWKLGDPRTRQAYLELAEAAPDYAPMFEDLLAIYADQHKLAEFVPIIRDIAARNPSCQIPAYYVGRTLEAMGDVDGAIEAYRTSTVPMAVSCLAKVLVKRGLARKQAGRIEEAIDAFREAIDKDTSCRDAFVELDTLLREQGDGQARLAEWRRIATALPDAAYGHVFLGDALQEAQDREGAVHAYAQALSIAPDNMEIQSRLNAAANPPPEAAPAPPEPVEGVPEAMQEAPESARQVPDAAQETPKEAYRKAIALDPYYYPAYDRLDEILIAEGAVDKRIEEWRGVIARFPDVPIAYSHLGRALEEKNDDEGAIEAYRTVLRIAPAASDSPRFLAHLLAGKGQSEEAIETLRAALVHHPDSVPLRTQLVETLRDLGRWEAAREEVAVCRAKKIELPLELVDALDGPARTGS